MFTWVLTCNDAIQAMIREDLTVSGDDLDEAWEKAKRRFARKYHTRVEYVTITGCRRIAS